MKWGITTGSCAALAAKAAALKLVEGVEPGEVEIPLPDGDRLIHAVRILDADAETARAITVKYAGDDPDVTDGNDVIVQIRYNQMDAVRFFAGPGVGTVTKPGLAVPPGEPAINPGPRNMIVQALAEVSPRGFDVTVSIPAGQELARKTFNPRLGIVGGISILGTTGRVRPFSAPALRDALKCALDIAAAAKLKDLVLVPGNMGHKAALQHFSVNAEQVIDVSNEWGFVLGEVEKYSVKHVLIVGHSGKLGKLAMEQWQTHSAQSQSAVPYIAALGKQLSLTVSSEINTVEELFMSALQRPERNRLGDLLAERIHSKISACYPGIQSLALVLINLQGEILGRRGDFSTWSKT
ncbi:cobalt-precorrin-5B (C(1))-methyltransferase CbiD [Trichloromonas sp.]|uniref:cobalt-precorrin-5B (C(1))-methyltransferase CbiD n=1 Tax=Trichloromonas sp. TaxID=3069249 RepID=UPI001DAB8E56|nr:cobalamin biosynthesis protein CbiD [Desulfuromonadaceae bacterium]MDY0269857.1 cobalt-precorrin-5B (C(1))-methyltransferase CbiD [Trichloromonas sp.]